MTLVTHLYTFRFNLWSYAFETSKYWASISPYVISIKYMKNSNNQIYSIKKVDIIVSRCMFVLYRTVKTWFCEKNGPKRENWPFSRSKLLCSKFPDLTSSIIVDAVSSASHLFVPMIPEGPLFSQPLTYIPKIEFPSKWTRPTYMTSYHVIIPKNKIFPLKFDFWKSNRTLILDFHCKINISIRAVTSYKKEKFSRQNRNSKFKIPD